MCERERERERHECWGPEFRICIFLFSFLGRRDLFETCVWAWPFFLFALIILRLLMKCYCNASVTVCLSKAVTCILTFYFLYLLLGLRVGRRSKETYEKEVSCRLTPFIPCRTFIFTKKKFFFVRLLAVDSVCHRVEALQMFAGAALKGFQLHCLDLFEWNFITN